VVVVGVIEVILQLEVTEATEVVGVVVVWAVHNPRPPARGIATGEYFTS